MSITDLLWSGAMRAVEAALPLLERGGGKVARGARARRGVRARVRAWAEHERDPGRPLVWFHASSVGEGLQAFAVMEVLRARRPDAQVVYTYFSPSAEGLARRAPADFADCLPLDSTGEVEAALDALQPGVIAFSKYDVWPTLVRRAKARGTRVALLSATLPESSSRLRGPARWLLSETYARLDAVAAISSADAERFERLGVAAARRSVMGDARFDQVAARAASVDPGSPLLRPLRDSPAPILVAGSTWPPDEERLVEAWAALGDLPRRLVLVPHEPTPAHLTRTAAHLAEHGLTHDLLGALAGEPPRSDVLVVDRVGVLGELYAVAALAYVGGGWGRAGLHSVLEPAAFAAPVLFGPRHDNAREAGELVEAGGGFAVASVAELTERLRTLLGDEPARRRAGDAALAYVRAGMGAAERGAAVVLELLGNGEEGTGKR